MIRIIKYLVPGLIWFASQPALAVLNVFACEPEWGALSQEIGGDKVKVFNATNALQDVHRIQARPSLIAAARNADIVVCSGLELEVGWLPVLLREGGNNKIQPGEPGYFEAGKFARVTEVPAFVDRSQGDVHPYGNPHLNTDPRNFLIVGDALAKRFAEIDHANAQEYQSRFKQFSERWRAAISRWEAQAAPLKGVPVVVHHKAYVYMADWLGLQEIGALEPKPGVEPTSSHLTELLSKLQRQPAKMIVRSA